MMYAPLQIFSSYSLLKNPNTVNEIISKAKDRGYQALALTDVNNIYGAVEFYHAAQQHHIKPILGVTLHVAGLVNTATAFPVICIATNDIGYRNLMRISSMKMTQDDQQLLSFNQFKHDLAGIAIILPHDSEIGQLIGTQTSVLNETWQQLTTFLNHDDLYVGIHPFLAPQILQNLTDFAQNNQAQLIALDDVDYLDPTDAFTTQVLRAIDTNTKLEGIELLRQQEGAHVLRPFHDIDQAYQATSTLRRAFENNEQLVDKINVSIAFKQVNLPQFVTPHQQTSMQYLEQLATEGLKQRLIKNKSSHDTYVERLNHELAVINALGFSDYFLIVWDILNFAHTHHIQTGPGRGSAAGSLVAYALHITDVDPIQFGLLFERFLNADRIQMPDIDIDLPDNKREQVLDYLHQKYGHRNFAQIITFGTLAARQALRDTARVFDLSQRDISRLSHTLPKKLHFTLQEAINETPQLSKLLGELPHGQLIFDTAQKIEGLPRNVSTHAAGIVLSESPLIQTLPVQKGSEDKLLTQFEKDTVENLGLLKIDLLGLRNLTLLSQALYYAKPYLPDHFDISTIPLDDPQTLALFAKGDTDGVFQFESAGIKNVLRRLQPTTFELVAAVNALYRPGPMQNINHFVARRYGKEPASLPDASLKTILAPTFGIIVYQEQVMRVAETYAGFTLGEADILRSAMSKKNVQKMSEMHDKFIQGAIAKGHEHQQADKIFNYIDEFANYGFNRSHAVAYSKMAYQLAYLKVNYPIAFFVALLNANLGNQDKVRLYVTAAKLRHIEVKAPDVNQSERFWTINQESLQMGLNNIRGVRTDFVTAVLAERQENGAFHSIQSFIRRIPEKLRKQEVLEQLAYAGALDHFGYNRAEILRALPDLIDAANFGDLILNETKIAQVEELALTERLNKEKEVIGVNLSGHPLDDYGTFISEQQLTQITDIKEADQKIGVLGLIDSVRTIRTKKGDLMAFVNISDTSGSLSVTVFPNLYQKVQDILKVGQIILISGKTETTRQVSLIAQQLNLAPKPTVSKASSRTWFLQFDAQHDNDDNKRRVSDVLKKHHGPIPVVVHWQNTGKSSQLEQKYWLSDETGIIRDLAPLLGADNIIFRR